MNALLLEEAQLNDEPAVEQVVADDESDVEGTEDDGRNLSELVSHVTGRQDCHLRL